MYQPTLPASPRPPALAPLSRSQAILLEGSYRGELDEVLPRLPAFDRVPFAAAGGISLLVDDVTDSGWTLSVVAALLRQAGSGAVFPLALASASGE